MAKRWSINTRIWAYRYLVARDGDKCQICGKVQTTQYSLDIDHKDGNPKNNDPSNLRLLCRECNQSQEIGRRRTRAAMCDKNVCVSDNGQPGTRTVRELVDYTQGSPEMKANSYFEVAFRQWILKEIKDKYAIEKKEATSTGAEIVGCSPMTVGRYIDKLTSNAGPLQEIKDLTGAKILTLKDEIRSAIEKANQPAPVPKKKIKTKKQPGSTSKTTT